MRLLVLFFLLLRMVPLAATTSHFREEVRINSGSSDLSQGCWVRHYNKKGQCLEATLWGNLTGKCEAPLILDDSGKPYDNDIERYTIHYVYDNAGNLLRQEEDNGSWIEFIYDKAKMVAIAIGYDAKTVAKFERDMDSQVISIDDGGYCPIPFPISDGILTHTTEIPTESKENHSTVERRYNARGEPIELFHPDGSSSQIVYALDGGISLEVLRDGSSIHYTRDPLKRPLSVEVYTPDGSLKKQISYEYQGLDEIISSDTAQKECTKENERALYTFWRNSIDTLQYWLHYSTDRCSMLLSRLRESYSVWNHAAPFVDPWIESIFPNAYLGFAGYNAQEMECDTQGNADAHPLLRITFINGMGNLRHDLLNNLEFILETHHNSKIHYVFHPTDGWTRDLFSCLRVTCGYASPYAKHLAALWRSLFASMGNQGYICHYAHSIGGADTAAALSLMTQEEKSRLLVTTIGSPTLIPSDACLHVLNYAGHNDPISMIGYATSILRQDQNTVYLQGESWIPFSEHTLATPTYRALFSNLGACFLKYVKKLEQGESLP